MTTFKVFSKPTNRWLIGLMVAGTAITGGIVSYQALSHEGVQSVSSVYISLGQWKNPETRINRAILIWGIDPQAPSLNLPEVKQNATYQFCMIACVA